MVHFTADTHFNHTKMIEYCNRPFCSKEDMNAHLTARWNTIVEPTDTVFHLGDFSLYQNRAARAALIHSLNGRIILVKGNHDKSIALGSVKEAFHDVVLTVSITCVYEEIPYTVYMKHLPWTSLELQARKPRELYLHGHCHGTAEHSGQLDVGTDCWHYYPVSFPQLLKLHMERASK